MAGDASLSTHVNHCSIPADSFETFPPDGFQDLVKALGDALGPSSGLDSDDVNTLEIQKIMAQYISKEEEWSSYALPDPSRPYTRNLVDEGNGKSNLVSSEDGLIQL